MADTKLAVHHTEFAEFHEGYVRHYIAFADTKAAIVFGACSSLVAFLITNNEISRALGGGCTALDLWLGYTAVASSILGAVLAGWVVLPRLPNVGEGMVFFGAVRNLESGAKYTELVRGCERAELTAARLQHCYTISVICWRKYVVLRAAMWLTYLGGATTAALLARIGV